MRDSCCAKILHALTLPNGNATRNERSLVEKVPMWHAPSTVRLPRPHRMPDLGNGDHIRP